MDKTKFIKEWWESRDDVTLIARPRRFGKTLTMSMLEDFFSNRYAGRGDLFEGLAIWQEEAYRQLQGTYPVISLSFGNIKDREFVTVRKKMCQILTDLYSQNRFCWKEIFWEKRNGTIFAEFPATWTMRLRRLRSISFRDFCPDIMAKK